MDDIQQKREALIKKYSKSFVARMSDAQVTAIYLRLKSQGKI